MNAQTASQLRFFPDHYPEAPDTQGIKYAGSKLKLLPQILWLAEKTGARSVFDAFSGSTRVSQAFAATGYKVISNDHAVWSEYFARCYLQGGNKARYEGLIKHLNGCKPVHGWFSEYYGGEVNEAASETRKKMPWQSHNTRKLDGIREEIDRLQLDPVSKAVAITSLIMALDEVDSTMGHFASYLREWSPRSYKEMRLVVPRIVEGDAPHEVHRADIFDVISSVSADLSYFDPPYGSNNEKMPPSRVRYAAYYHPWTTICLNDRPELFGKVHRRSDSRDEAAGSVFEEFRRNQEGRFIAVEAIHKLLKASRSKYIILSYSSGGRATAKELSSAIEDTGKLLEVVEVDYKKNVMAGMTWTNEWLRDAEAPHREFLFLIQRR